MCIMIGQFILSQLECALFLVNLLYFSVRMCTMIGQFIISVRMCTIIDQFIVFLS